MLKQISIGHKKLGHGQPTYFIADIAANHDSDLLRAKELIFQCAEAGADAAKFQNFDAASIVSDVGFKQLPQMAHQASWKKSVFQVYEAASLNLDWTEELKATCESAGVEYLTTPYSIEIAKSIRTKVNAWKIGSGDITWHEFIEHLAQDNIPILLATGAANYKEVENAYEVAKRHCKDIVLMQCNTNYTGDVSNFEHIALNVLKTYQKKFPEAITGLSDHTPKHATVLGAVALGASVIEKHFTDDNDRDGPDHAFSLTSSSWREMVDRTRELEVALGDETKKIMPNEKDSAVVQRRAIRASQDLKAGTVIVDSMLIPLRPCPKEALAPFQKAKLIGKTLLIDINAGDLVLPTDCRH